jgi:hypothetical protein
VALDYGDHSASIGVKGAERDIWTLIDSRVQRWTMSVEGAWEELALDQDISDVIGPEVRTRFTRLAAQDEPDLDLEFLDLQVVRFVIDQRVETYESVDTVTFQTGFASSAHIICRSR